MQKVILKYCALKFVFNYIQSGVGAHPVMLSLPKHPAVKRIYCLFLFATLDPSTTLRMTRRVLNFTILSYRVWVSHPQLFIINY